MSRTIIRPDAAKPQLFDTYTPFPAFDDSDVLTESDFNLFDADHTSQDAL